MLKIVDIFLNPDGSLVRQKLGADNLPDPTKPKYITLYVVDTAGLMNDTSPPTPVNIVQSSRVRNGVTEFTWGAVNPNDWAARKGQTVPGCILNLSAEKHEILPRKFIASRGANAGKEMYAFTRRIAVLGVESPNESQVLRAQQIAGFSRPNKTSSEIALQKAYAEIRAQLLPAEAAQPAAHAAAPDNMEQPVRVGG